MIPAYKLTNKEISRNIPSAIACVANHYLRNYLFFSWCKDKKSTTIRNVAIWIFKAGLLVVMVANDFDFFCGGSVKLTELAGATIAKWFQRGLTRA